MCAYCEQGPRLHSSIMEEEKKKEGTEGIRGKREKGREDVRKGNPKRETKGQREGNSSEKSPKITQLWESEYRDGDSSACAVVGDSSSVTSKPLSY